MPADCQTPSIYRPRMVTLLSNCSTGATRRTLTVWPRTSTRSACWLQIVHPPSRSCLLPALKGTLEDRTESRQCASVPADAQPDRYHR